MLTFKRYFGLGVALIIVGYPLVMVCMGVVNNPVVFGNVMTIMLIGVGLAIGWCLND